MRQVLERLETRDYVPVSELAKYFSVSEVTVRSDLGELARQGLAARVRGGVRATTIYPGFVKTDMTAKNKFYMPFLMELDDAIQVMARGIGRGAKTISYPLPLVAMVKTLHALPRGIL